MNDEHLDIVCIKGRTYTGLFEGQLQTKSLSLAPGNINTYYYWNCRGVIQNDHTHSIHNLRLQTPYLQKRPHIPDYTLMDSIVFFHQNDASKEYCNGFTPFLLPQRYPDMVDFMLGRLVAIADQNEGFAKVPRVSLIELVKQRLCIGVMKEGKILRYLVPGNELLP